MKPTLLFLVVLGSGVVNVCRGLSSQLSEVAPATKEALAGAKEKASRVWTTIATASPSERDRQVLPVTIGQIPKGLVGTYYVNGLASCQFADSRLIHPFETHGFFKAIHFGASRQDDDDDYDDEGDNEAQLQAKYVETPVFKWETFFQRPLFRGAMSSIADQSTLTGRLLNALSPTERETANLAVRPWAGKLLVSADNCPFFRLDSETLETLGVEDFDGVLAGEKMMAHTRVDSERERLISCSLQYDVNNQATILRFYEFDKEGQLISKVEHTQSPACVFHDWMITENYYVVPGAKIDFNLQKLPDLISGKGAAVDILDVDEDAPASVLLIPRDANSEKQPMVVEATMQDGRHGVVFHMGPCHEEKDGTVVLYPMVFERYQFGDEMGFNLEAQKFDPIRWGVQNGGPRLEEWKVRVDPVDAGRGIMTAKRLHNVVSDMPTFHPNREGSRCRFLYTVCGVREEGWFPFNCIAKHDLYTGDVEVWPTEASNAVSGKDAWDGGSSVWSEPLFVPSAEATGEDDGYILSTCHDSEEGRTTLNIFEAHRFGLGPVATLDLGELWGWNVHSSFAPK